jgi:hypothetical protein
MVRDLMHVIPGSVVETGMDASEDAGQRSKSMNDEATYICGSCGEEIVIPVDLSQGDEQAFVEDCPVCCRANVIHIEVHADGEISARAELE